jgi:hypothetical protein
VPVSGAATVIGDVKLRIDGLSGCSPNGAANAEIDHTFVGDLLIGLKAPDGTTVNVINRINAGLTPGPHFCDTTLDDQSIGNSIKTATNTSAPFSGTGSPSAPLSGFRLKNANGTWQLLATDYYNIGSGHINRFSLIITPYALTSNAIGIGATRSPMQIEAFLHSAMP